ncbi:FmdB family zinc ribbon protein [uncultured Zhongshania sp.]|jgi:putative FmdB family regulatory protein|uniref:FmdB family zinc ribbon protein n=1 Tax=uncultured Zhongshania sp. TaxID=1642288 RepID=UPI0025D85E78|nr:FmdB family zinc ribbon protein [uncultured Zhongshania sp.]|tara:strand:- start:1465 stop:1854 length:390 start_codon:yes stop_codon:yes gene_type:complete
MPVYDYKCNEHGLFHELASMEQAAMPCACPSCGKLSARVIMIPPEVLAMSPARRQAMAKNEKAVHQPIFSTVDYREDQAQRRAHAAAKKGCGCGDHTAHPDRSSLRQKAIYMADGSKVFPSQRPWMISH